MATENLKTSAITQLDQGAAGGTIAAGGTGRSPSGYGGEGYLKEVNGIITPTTASTSAGSVYQFARVPTNCVIKHIFSVAQGFTTTPVFTGDVTLYYSDSLGDGTLPALQGTQVVAALFAAAHTFGSDNQAGVPVELTYLNQSAGKYGALGVDERNQPLWQAAGLTGDPGGYFDIVVVSTVANTGVMGTVQFSVQFMTWGQ